MGCGKGVMTARTLARILARGDLPPALTASLALHATGLAGLAAAPELWSWVVGALTANHAVLAAAGMMPRSAFSGPNIVRLPPEAAALGEVALTFDDGPDPAGTPAVLDILDRRGVRASFFCIGARAERHPALVREIAARGHCVENHTFCHPNGFAFRGPRGLAAEIGRAQILLTALTGRSPRFFRAPMGLRGPLLEPVLQRFGLSLVSWTRRGRDGLRADPDAVLARLARGLSGGDVLVLHDGGPMGGSVAVRVLPRLLDAIAARGLRVVPLEGGTPGVVPSVDAARTGCAA